MNVFIFLTCFYTGLIFSFLFRRYLNRSKFTAGSGTYTVPKGANSIRVEMVGGGGGGSANINGAAAIGETGFPYGKGGRGVVFIANDKGKVTKIYYNEKGERVVEEYYQ